MDAKTASSLCNYVGNYSVTHLSYFKRVVGVFSKDCPEDCQWQQLLPSSLSQKQLTTSRLQLSNTPRQNHRLLVAADVRHLIIGGRE